MIQRWTVVSVCIYPVWSIPYTMAVLNSLADALEYVTWVCEYDNEYFKDSPVQWITYIVEGDFINV